MMHKKAVKVPVVGTDVYIKNKRLIVHEYCFSEFVFIEKNAITKAFI